MLSVSSMLPLLSEVIQELGQRHSPLSQDQLIGLPVLQNCHSVGVDLLLLRLLTDLPTSLTELPKIVADDMNQPFPLTIEMPGEHQIQNSKKEMVTQKM